jgi:cobyric acid synthase
MGDKPTGSLYQTYWATSDRRSIPWAVINKFVEDDALLTAAKTSS